MAVTKAICNQKDFVTDIGDICTHVTAIADPWVGNGCDMSAHRLHRVCLGLIYYYLQKGEKRKL